MKIVLQEQKKVKVNIKKALFLPFFTGEKINIKNQEIKKKIDNFSSIIPSLLENEPRLFFSKEGIFIFINLGEKTKWNQRKFLLMLRKAVRYLKINRIKETTFFLEQIIPQDANLNALVQQATENILLADYDFIKYKEKPKEGWPEVSLIELTWDNPLKYKKNLICGEIISQSVNLVRDLANIPGKDMTPQNFALAAESTLKNFKNVKVEIFDEKKIKNLGMGGIIGVSQGSSQKPRLIILEYIGRKKNKNIDLAFVGKGVTFDTGGLNIKPADFMKEGMQMDMSGGASVLGAILAIVKMKLSLNIAGIIPAVENMPSGEALRPGDILKSYNGKTIEVINTDAEGRIILADALSYAINNFKPKMIIDLATLTGSAVVALGQRAIALFTNLSQLETDFRKLGEESGDYVWPLPCWEEYEEEIQGTFGDIANSGKIKYGGAITGAMFLKSFVEDLPWIHLDISPTMISIDDQGLSKGATGTGTRYLVKLAQDFEKIKKEI